jgi:hypothetical protein
MTRRRKMQWTRVRPLRRQLLLRGDIPDPKRSHYRASTLCHTLCELMGMAERSERTEGSWFGSNSEVSEDARLRARLQLCSTQAVTLNNGELVSRDTAVKPRSDA